MRIQKTIHFGTLAILCAAAGGLGCGLERLFPEDVASGVARLTVRNAGAILGTVNADTRCGFASEEVLKHPRVEGAVGGNGTVTWRVDSCAFDFGGSKPISEPNCHGEGASNGSGKFTVSAERTVTGIITGNELNPVVPAGPDAVLIRATVSFEDFSVEGDDGNVLTQRSGTLSFRAHPRLAIANETPGVCAAPTPNAMFSGVTYTDALVHVRTPTNAFEVEVPTSEFSAVNGAHGNRENDVEGTVSLWDGEEVSVQGALDEEYDAAHFVESYAKDGCVPDGAGTDETVKSIALPVDFGCAGPGSQLAPGVARLGVMTMGTIAGLIESNTECGFSAKSVVENPSIEQDGAGRGSATFRVEACELRFPEHMIVDEDCRGISTMASGKIVVTAEKILRGRVTGHPANPVLPLHDTPAEVSIESVTFDHFRVTSTGQSESLYVKSGQASGRIVPRTARGLSTGACSVATPIARLSSLMFHELDAQVVAPQGAFNVRVDAATLEATNGSWGEKTNVLEGSITVDGETYALPIEGDEGLVPNFDLEDFEAGWKACTADLELPIVHDACDLEPKLISGAARLTVNTFGQVATAIESDTTCGFASASVIDAVAVDGELGVAGGTAVYAIENCVIDLDEPLALESDCNGSSSSIVGRVSVSGTKTLRGIVSGDPNEPIVPTSWNPAEIEITISFEDFTVRSDGLAEALTVEHGTLSGRVQPRTGIDARFGACAIPTAVARISDLAWTDASLRVVSGDNYVTLPVPTSMLLAQNGDDGEYENHLSGTFAVGTESHEVPYDTVEPILDPSYDKDVFLAGFACTPHLQLPYSDDECSFNRVLGEGAARLIVQAVGEAASMVNADGDCGFTNLGILMDSVKTPEDGQAGDMGALTFFTENCVMPAAPDGDDVPVSVDCTGRKKYRKGQLSVTSTRVVEGELEEISIFGINIADSIIPRVRDAVLVELEDVTFENFEISSVRTDGTEDLGVLNIESGSVTSTVRPVLGENADDPGVFMTPTPVSAVDEIESSSMTAILYAQGKTFRLNIGPTSLDAFNGTYQGRSNEISGSLVVNGETIVLNPQSLDPEFNQSSFDQSYACTDNLVGPIPAF